MANSNSNSISYDKNNNFNLIRLIAAIAVFIQHKKGYRFSIIASFIVTGICAMLSWHFIEKPFLKLKYK
ncbi:MAG: hypothetical protein WCP57_02455 [Bacteroidota bacterium]